MCNGNEPNHQFYSSFVSVRNTELAAYWTRYNILAAVNLALLAAALAANTSSLIRYCPWLISGGGIVLSFIWLLITIKSKQLLENRWDKHIRDYEGALKDNRIKLFTNVYSEEDKKSWVKKHYDNLNILARLLPILCIVGWLTFGYYITAAKSENQKIDKIQIAIEKLTDNTNKQLIEIQDLKIQLKEIQSKISNLGDLHKQSRRGKDLRKE